LFARLFVFGTLTCVLQFRRKDKRITDTEIWNKAFFITSVTREDVVATGFPKATALQLSDEDMQQIAAAMEDAYCNSGFWEDLALCTNRVLKRKEEDAMLDQQIQTSGEEE
jgi:hypothetical protein